MLYYSGEVPAQLGFCGPERALPYLKNTVIFAGKMEASILRIT